MGLLGNGEIDWSTSLKKLLIPNSLCFLLHFRSYFFPETNKKIKEYFYLYAKKVTLKK